MGMFGKIKVRFVTMLAALGLIASAPIALTVCGTDYENEATKKAVKILESATKDVKNIDDEIKDAEALIEHIGKLEKDDQNQSGKVAEEALKALTDVKKVVDQGTALPTSDDSLEQQWDAYYDAYDAQVALQDLGKIVQNVQGWPKDQFGEYISAMEGLEKATLKAIGKGEPTISVEEQEAEQNGQEGQQTEQAEQEGQEGQEAEQTEQEGQAEQEAGQTKQDGHAEEQTEQDSEIVSPARAIGRKAGRAFGEFRKGLKEGVEFVEQKVEDENAKNAQAAQEAGEADKEAEKQKAAWEDFEQSN